MPTTGTTTARAIRHRRLEPDGDEGSAVADGLKFGSLPPAADSDHPTAAETAAVCKKVAEYQRDFNTH
jgi:hypothetical protein